MHRSIPEQVLSGLSPLNVELIALFLQKRLRDFSTEATRDVMTVVFHFVLSLCLWLYLLSFIIFLPFYRVLLSSPKAFLPSKQAAMSTLNTVGLITHGGYCSRGPILQCCMTVMEPLGTRVTISTKEDLHIWAVIGNAVPAWLSPRAIRWQAADREDLSKRIAVSLSCRGVCRGI